MRTSPYNNISSFQNHNQSTNYQNNFPNNNNMYYTQPFYNYTHTYCPDCLHDSFEKTDMCKKKTKKTPIKSKYQPPPPSPPFRKPHNHSQSTNNSDMLSFDGDTISGQIIVPAGGDISNLMDLFSSVFKNGPGEESRVNGSKKSATPSTIIEEDLSQYDYKYSGPIKDIKDLIRLGTEYNNSKVKYRYNINMSKLANIIEPLRELDTLIGMKELKTAIFTKLVFYLQELEPNKDMLHLSIEGTPGVGKSTVIAILAKIYKGLGILPSGHITYAKRDDFVPGYVGQTSIKARKLLDKAKGGILVLDEAHAFGCEEHKDSFAKEAMDLITAYATEVASDLVIIIAGYKDQLDKNFFGYNDGLNRRFTRYTINGYTPEELRLIFLKIIKENNWSVDENNIPIGFFNNNKQYFIFNGGDMYTLFTLCKNAHSKRLLEIESEPELIKSKKNINEQDLKSAFKLFLLDPDVAKRNDVGAYVNMYM